MANRSINTYQKIDTIFKRDANNIIMPYAGFVYPELEWLRNCKFDATEKIDGTNMRIEVSTNYNATSVSFDVAYKGKTDDAQIPKHLATYMSSQFPEESVLNALGLKKEIPMAEWQDHKWGDVDQKTGVFTPNALKVPAMHTIYGEGYGMKIQKGGNYISNGVGFIVFDVKVNETYLLRDQMESIANLLGAPHVPYMGQFTIDEAIEFVRKGFKSTIAENKDYDAEGLVLKAPLGLKTRMGDRIIFKVKTRDFAQYRNKYGTDDPVDQPENLKYKV